MITRVALLRIQREGRIELPPPSLKAPARIDLTQLPQTDPPSPLTAMPQSLDEVRPLQYQIIRGGTHSREPGIHLSNGTTTLATVRFPVRRCVTWCVRSVVSRLRCSGMAPPPGKPSPATVSSAGALRYEDRVCRMSPQCQIPDPAMDSNPQSCRNILIIGDFAHHLRVQQQQLVAFSFCTYLKVYSTIFQNGFIFHIALGGHGRNVSEPLEPSNLNSKFACF